MRRQGVIPAKGGQRMTSWWQKTRTTTSNLTTLAGGAVTLLTNRRQPQKSGTIYCKELRLPVEISTDRYGVPHIYAHNEDDLYFAHGYIHAQERLWQMEFNRRISSGRLSEIFGNQTLETDRFCRRLGMHRTAAAEIKTLPAEDLRILEVYTRGVNSFIAQNRQKLPVEFTLLHIQPEPWEPIDTVRWGKLQALSLSGNWENELIRARLVDKLGPERAALLEAGYDAQLPLIVPPGVAYRGTNLAILEQYEQIRLMSGFSVMGGSNNWVVDGTMTATGSPMLCNDPHMGQTVPSIWFECHLVGGAIDSTGVSFPGAPGIIIGHNQHIAWGVTNAVSDIQDLYIEKFNPEHPSQYEFAGQWEEAQIMREEIVVKGLDQPVVEEVRVTRHGPILTHLPATSQTQSPASSTGSKDNKDNQDNSELPLALRWTASEPGTLISAVRKLNHATNWQEFRSALRLWDVPPQNFVYADIQGNIGYIMAGAIPIRAKGNALIPVPGWTGTYEWTGTIPFDELPQTYNPEQHFIVTANNRVVDDSYPYYISHEWANGYRAKRIQDLLTSKDKLTLDDMAAIQFDQYALPAEEIVPLMLKIDATNGIKRAANEILQSWDYQLKPESIAASIYTTFLRRIERIAFDTLLGNDEILLQNYLGQGSTTLSPHNGNLGRDIPLLIRLIRQQDDQWFVNSILPNGPTSWKIAFERAFDGTIGELTDKLGGNILRWQYQGLHTITYTHPLGTVKALAGFFNRGPFPIGGNTDTVNVSHAAIADPYNVTAVAAYRQIIDMQQLDNSQSIHAPGQSGHPASKHYDDFIQLWRDGLYHKMLFTRTAVDAAEEDKLRLIPKNL
jgi:penicillin amidase